MDSPIGGLRDVRANIRAARGPGTIPPPGRCSVQQAVLDLRYGMSHDTTGRLTKIDYRRRVTMIRQRTGIAEEV
ncbi:hypothetical protein ACN3XK_73990 [Actinomadura welshii]